MSAMFSYLLATKYIFVFTLLVSLNILGDGIISKITNEYPVNDYTIVAKALADNLTHGLIAFCSWTLVTHLDYNISNQMSFINPYLCAFLACAIDIDHFVSARSLHLKDALRLKTRPPLHCTSVLLILIVFILIYGVYFVNESAVNISCLLFVAVFTHHLRDGLRRGLWMYPLSRRLLVDSSIYWCLLFLIPIFIHFVLTFCKKTMKYNMLNKLENVNV